jgi:hypothetical protein
MEYLNDLLVRALSHQPVPQQSKVPTKDGPYPYSSLQIFGLSLMFILLALATVVCGLRAYSRMLTKTFGLGKFLDPLNSLKMSRLTFGI